MRRTGNRLAPSVAVENSLYDDVSPLVHVMFEKVDVAMRRCTLSRVREPIIETFRRHSRTITQRFISRVVSHTMSAFKSATKGFDAKAKDLLTSARSVRRMEKRWAECESLVKDIPVLFFKKLDLAVRQYNDRLLTKDRLDARYDELKRQTYGRLRLIAETQNARATEAMFINRCEEGGIQLVQWRHTHLPEQKPRDYHLRKWDGHSGKRNGRPNGLNGYVFRLDNPPVIDLKTGERGFPAQLVNCKCYLVPVEDTPVARKGRSVV